MNAYSVEFLGNGLVSIFDRGSKLRGCYYPSGVHRHGDLYLPRHLAKQIIDYNTRP